LLKNAETKNFHADDHFDVEPTDSAKAGQYVKAKWLGEYPRNWELVFTDGSKGSGGFDNATQLANWLQNNDVGPVGHKSRGQGVKFESLPSTDQATADAATTENEDDSNGDLETSTDGVGANLEPEESEKDNTLLYGGIGVGVLALILVLKK